MAGFDKVVTTCAEAPDSLQDGMTLSAGGFGLCGVHGDRKDLLSLQNMIVEHVLSSKKVIICTFCAGKT